MITHPQSDVCVIGLGASGGVIAAELAKAGMSVVALEAGPRYGEETFAESSGAQDELAHLRLGELRWNQPEKLYYNDFPPMTCSVIARNIGVGGPLHWSCISYRFHESDFRVRSVSGAVPGSSVEDWPLSYTDLAPYYERAESEFGVSGLAGANPFEAPRSTSYPMPPLPLLPAGRLFQETAVRLGYSPYPIPAAIATQAAYKGNEVRRSCNDCGRCTFYACAQHAKGVTLDVCLPEALATGNLTIRDGCTATEISVADSCARSVVYIDRFGELHEQPATVVVLCNNAAYVARLLLLSRSSAFPQGLANRSGMVGKNLTFHGSVCGYGTFDDRVLDAGESREAAVAFDDLNEDRPRQQYGQTFIRGGLISGGIALPFTGGPLAFATALGALVPLPPGVETWGHSFKRFVTRYYRRHLAIFALLEDLPVESNRVELDPELKDSLGLPLLRIIYRDHPNTLAMQRFMRSRIEELLKAAGARDVVTMIPPVPGGAAAGHVMGTTRMGDDPARSVVNRYCQAHDVPNLFIGGSGVFVTSAGVNPTLTIFALAYRTAEHIAKLWREGALHRKLDYAARY